MITYFDEVKPTGIDQPYYWLGGLMFEDQVNQPIEQEINSLAVKCFGKGTGLTKQTEFHATDIASGSRNFKKVRNQFDILKQLIQIYDKPDGVYRVAVRIDTNKMYTGADIEQIALVYLVERVNTLARGKKTHAILIGDFEKESAVNRSVQNLAQYRDDGTPFAFWQDLDSLIDTIRFAHSHHSRLLQMADTYMWTQQLRHRTSKQSGLRADLIRFISEETNTDWEHKFKYWPPS